MVIDGLVPDLLEMSSLKPPQGTLVVSFHLKIRREPLLFGEILLYTIL